MVGDDMDWAALAAFLRATRSSKRMSQTRLADRARVSLRTVASLESGRPHPRAPRCLPRVDRALGLPAGTVTAVLLREPAP